MVIKSVKSYKKKCSVIIATYMMFALLLVGTYAWNDFDKHKANMLIEASEIIDVTLNNYSTVTSDWKEKGTVDKIISVSNFKQSKLPVFVRICIKEYMEAQIIDPDIFIEEKGKRLMFAAWSSGSKKGEYITYDEALSLDYKKYKEYNVQSGIDSEGQPIFEKYAVINTKDKIEGVYGKPMIDPGIFKIWGDVPKADITHKLQGSEECKYEAYLWGEHKGVKSQAADDEDYIRNYIKLITGDSVMTLDEWYNNTEAELGAYWIIDVTDGWVYWGEPLEYGWHTSNFLESIELIELPGYKFDYYMHVDMQVADGEHFDEELDKYNSQEGNSPEKERLIELFKYEIEAKI